MQLRQFLKRNPVTVFLIAANVLIFLYQSAGGPVRMNQILSDYSLFTPLVLDDREYYRLFTAVFLHFGMEHLYSNMISLFALGSYAERAYGSIRFCLIYLIAGICGNLLTMLTDVLFTGGGYAISAGASGAVCGLLGIFFVFALDPQMRKMFPMKRVLIAAALMLIPGLTESNVNFVAHFGGAVSGFISALVLKPHRI